MKRHQDYRKRLLVLRGLDGESMTVTNEHVTRQKGMAPRAYTLRHNHEARKEAELIANKAHYFETLPPIRPDLLSFSNSFIH